MQSMSIQALHTPICWMVVHLLMWRVIYAGITHSDPFTKQYDVVSPFDVRSHSRQRTSMKPDDSKEEDEPTIGQR